MSWILWGAAGLLGGMLLWGLIAPRSQWRVLVGWSASDPFRSEPGDAVHGVTRIVCLLGLLGLLAFGGVQLWSSIASRPVAAPDPSALERMWGSPAPRLVDRVVVPTPDPPEGLVAGPVVGVQELERGWAPDYLVGVGRWSLLGDPSPSGLIGAYPGDGYNGYGISDLLVAAQGPLTCIPRIAAVGTDEDGQLRIGVYWGLAGEAEQDHLTGCAIEDGQLLQTVLLPVQLDEPLDGRDVVTFAGAPVPPVPVIDG